MLTNNVLAGGMTLFFKKLFESLELLKSAQKAKAASRTSGYRF
jgi:hypothetical protein